MLLHQGHDSSSAGDAAVMLGKPSEHLLATGEKNQGEKMLVAKHCSLAM